MNFFISLSSRRIINIQYNPSVSNSLKRYKAVNFEPKLRKILDWFSRQWLVALIMHLHCFELACNCKFHYIISSYNAWVLSEDVVKSKIRQWHLHTYCKIIQDAVKFKRRIANYYKSIEVRRILLVCLLHLGPGKNVDCKKSRIQLMALMAGHLFRHMIDRGRKYYAIQTPF